MPDYYVAGVDAGGTLSELRVLSPQGVTLFLRRIGSFNASTGYLPQFSKELKRAVDDAVREKGIPSISFLVMGVAGAWDREAARFIEGQVRKKGVATEVRVLPDYVVAHYGAFRGEPGVIVISGTGSVAYGSDGEREERRGGFGPLIGDPGSGYWIGKEAFLALLKREEGWGKESEMFDIIKRVLNLEGRAPHSFLRSFDLGEQVKGIASLAPIVLDCAARGDSLAKRVVEAALRDLVEMTLQVLLLLNLEGQAKVRTTGGVLRSPYFFKGFSKALRNRVRNLSISYSRFTPSLGAALLALKLFRERG